MNEPTIVTQSLSTIESTEAPETSSAEPANTEAPAPAAPPAGTEAAVAPAPPEGDRPLDLEVAKRFGSVARREAKARQQEVQVHTALSTLQEQAAELKKAQEEFQRDREAFEADPAGFAMKRGRDPVDLARKIAKPKTDIEMELEKIKETLAQREAREAKERTDREARESAARQHSARVEFVRSITPDECPTLVAEFEAHQVPELLDAVLHRPAPVNPVSARAIDRFVSRHGQQPTTLQLFQFVNGRNPTDGELRESLEQEAVLRATSREERKKRYMPPAPASPAEASGVASGPNGISNQHAAVTNGATPKRMSLEERRKQAKRQVVSELEAESGTADE